MLSNIPVFYEDEWFEILNKPPGLLTVPSPGNTSRSLTQILNEDLEKEGVSYRLHPCHRLDKETSGLVIYAKGKSAQEKLMQLFKSRNISKTYIAFVHGRIEQDKGLITSPIEGQAASTCFEVLERRRDFSVVELRPETGRTNQIRIHFKAIGHPLVGESKFVFRRDFVLRSKRICLHATRLEFIHPWTKEVVAIDSPLARDMQKFLEDHRDHSATPNQKKSVKK